MLVAIQFPFTDARAFLQGDTHQVAAPSWGNVDPTRDFVRAIGPIRTRRKGPVEGWPEEDAFCRVSSALRFDPSYHLVAEPKLIPLGYRRFCAFRRFLADGRFAEGSVVARLELGFGFRLRVRGEVEPSPEQCLECAISTLKLPVTLRGNGSDRQMKIINLREMFDGLYLRSTTKRTQGAQPAVQSWWFRSGLPLALVEFSASNPALQLPNAKRVPALASLGINLSYLKIEIAGVPVGVWLLGLHQGMKDPDLLRRLRIHLLRLHAERQSIAEVLRLIRQKKISVVPGTQPTENLQSFLSKAISFLKSQTRDGLPQSEILKASEVAEDFARPGEREGLLAELEKIRPGVLGKVKDFVKTQTNERTTLMQQNKVFISHASTDKPFVRKLVDELKRHKLNVWFDEQEIKVGDSIVTRISEGLKDTDYLVIVLSKASVGSSWVREELNAALMDEISGKGGAVLPVLMEDCEIPPLLRSRLYADFRVDFETGLKKLLAVLEQEGESAVQVTAGVPKVTDAPCSKTLSALPLADLRRRITKRMDRAEVGAVWYDVFNKKMDDDMANRPLVDCVIELLDRAKNRSKLPDVIDGVCAERADLANP